MTNSQGRVLSEDTLLPSITPVLDGKLVSRRTKTHLLSLHYGRRFTFSHFNSLFCGQILIAFKTMQRRKFNCSLNILVFFFYIHDFSFSTNINEDLLYTKNWVGTECACITGVLPGQASHSGPVEAQQLEQNGNFLVSLLMRTQVLLLVWGYCEGHVSVAAHNSLPHLSSLVTCLAWLRTHPLWPRSWGIC